MNENDNDLRIAELATEQNENMIGGILNNIALPLLEEKPPDRVKEPLCSKRSREREER